MGKFEVKISLIDLYVFRKCLCGSVCISTFPANYEILDLGVLTEIYESDKIAIFKKNNFTYFLF